MKANIRAAVPADAGAIVALLAAVAAENMWIRTEIPFDAAEREQRLVADMATGGIVSFVAESGALVVGELTLRFHADRAALGMVVAAAHRGRGIGRELLVRAIAKARERVVSHIELAVYAHNTAAIALYRSLDFLESGPCAVEVRSDGQRWEALPMSKDLR